MMKSMTLLSLCFGLFFNAYAQRSSLQNSIAVKKVFTKHEIRQLDLLLNFFESQICTDESIALNKCYAQYISNILTDTTSCKLDFNISFVEQEKVYKQIDSLLINEIWWFGEITIDDTLGGFKYISLKSTGKYASFLRLLGKRNSVIHEYQQSALGIDFYAPSFVAGMVQSPTVFNLSDPDVRLVLAIHFLTMNDYANRMEWF